jgi:hypothetical protein
LEGLDNLSYNSRGWVTNKHNLVRLAEKYELIKVVRWQPLNVRSSPFKLSLYGLIPMLTLNNSPMTSMPPVLMSSLPTLCSPLLARSPWNEVVRKPTSLRGKRF